MEDFVNLLQRDYGIKPQGKMAPMSAAKATASNEPTIKGKSNSVGSSNARSARASLGDDDLFFGTKARNASSSSEQLGGSYDDVFGGPPKFAPPKHSSPSVASVPVYEDIFRSQPPPPPSSSSSRDHSLPVFDAPYEDDIFVGVRGTRSSGVSYDNVFGGGAGGGASSSGSPTDDLLGGYRSGPKTKAHPPQFDTGSTPYDDDLIPGMGSGYTSSKQPEPQSFISVDDFAPAPADVDPFVGIEPDPSFSGVPSVSDPLDPFTGYPKSVRQSFGSSRKVEEDADSDDSLPEKKVEVVQEEYVPEKEYAPKEDYIPADSYGSGDFTDEPASRDLKESWVTVDSVRLLTDPTVAPPPSRPPPGFGYHKSPYVNGRHNFQGGLSDDEDEAEASVKDDKERELQRKAEREEEDRIQREREEKERLRREREAVERATQEARQRAAKQARERVERIAVEKATAEARERAGAEARQRAAERAAAEKAAAEKAAAETRARERAAVDRINAQVRERAAEEARMAAEKKAEERAAVEKINAQVRERAAEEARKAQQRAKEQRSSADDFDVFGRATSAPKQRPPTSDSSKSRGPSGAPVKKVSSVSGIDELTNLFDNPSSPFKEIDGETPDRRKARMERDQRTQARARQALEEKHRRDLATQREQAEKHRASEALDSEIKRWAAGKEGNLRALLSTLQYVLWPDCGWQPVSLTELLTGAAVKKVYRKATLCVHPDKVQQKGATIQQKYIAEKVFDLLKEAWNKFNSEELF